MKLSHYKMKDKQEDLGDLKRSSRNKWAEGYEDLIRELCPLLISYDVDSTQGLNWSEFSYTEYLGGIYLNTQNIETNTRLIRQASKEHCDIDYLRQTLELCTDKYDLNKDYTGDVKVKHLGFMAGHNMLDIISSENVKRITFENEEFMMKLHPLTDEEHAKMIASNLGWNRIIRADVSGVSLLKNCEVAYVHSATELTSMAVLMDKKIVNISNFNTESMGIYYPINSALFLSSNQKETLNNIIGCEYSGILLPFMSKEQIETRIKAYFAKAMELRELLKPLAPPSTLVKNNKKGCCG